MEHEWKIGDWAECNGIRYLCYRSDISTHFVDENGRAWCPLQCDVKHLPDCTGWDWKPPKPIEPPEGYRLLTEGEVIRPSDMWFDDSWAVIDKVSCAIGGEWNPRDYLPMVRKIEPKYRPFANTAEFAPHRDKWVKWKGDEDYFFVHRIRGYSETAVWLGLSTDGLPWEAMFAKVKFEDGTPFGVKE